MENKTNKEIRTEEKFQHQIFKTNVHIFPQANIKTVNRMMYLYSILKCIQEGNAPFENYPEIMENTIVIREWKKINYSEYDRSKKLSPNVSYHANFDAYLSEENLINWTGIISLDFDDKDLNGLVPDQIKHELKKYEFIIAAWKSISGTGVHALAYIPGIDSKEKYNAAYRQLTIKFKNEGSLMLDQKANNTTQILFLSYDPDIYINHSPDPYPFQLNEEIDAQYFSIFPSKAPILITKEVANYTIYPKIYNHWKKRLKSYYASLLIYEKENFMPLAFDENLKFNAEKHDLDRFVSDLLIEMQPFHNAYKTLAYIPGGLASIDINLFEGRLIVDGTRKRTLLALMIGMAFINKYMRHKEYDNLDKKDFYHIASILNERCVTKKENGKQTLYPVEEDKIRFITEVVYLAYQTGKMYPKINCKKFISTKDHLMICRLSSDKNKKATRAREMLALLKQVKAQTSITLDEIILTVLKDLPTDTTYSVPELARLISAQCNYKERYITNQLYIKMKATQQDNTFEGNNIKQFIKPVCNLPVSYEQVVCGYHKVMELGIKPTQKAIGKIISVSPRTISKHWKRLQSEMISTQEKNQ